MAPDADVLLGTTHEHRAGFVYAREHPEERPGIRQWLVGPSLNRWG
ncbi:hypothetical protein OIE68_40165 [Nocardia vinacea]|nr:hypothetical protein OIE68_40165 [Nocardia vinacea]